MTIDDLIRELRPAPWISDAACRGMGPDLFFPERGVTGNCGNPAVDVCMSCPVRSECEEYGRGEKFGIWGGLSGRARRISNRQRETERRTALIREGAHH